MPRRVPRQQQIRQVRASDQQHQPDRANQHQQYCFLLASPQIGQRPQRRPNVSIRRIPRCQSRRHRLQVRLRLYHGNAWLHAPDHPIPAISSLKLLPLLRIRDERRPHRHVAVKPRRHRIGNHADDGVRLFVHLDDFSDDVRVGVIPVAPVLLAQHRHIISSRCIRSRCPHFADDRPNTQNRKPRSLHNAHHLLFRSVSIRQPAHAFAPRVVDRHGVERVIFSGKIARIQRRRINPLATPRERTPEPTGRDWETATAAKAWR